MRNLIILPMTKSNLKYWSKAKRIQKDYNIIGIDVCNSLNDEGLNIGIISPDKYIAMIKKNDILLLMMDINDFKEFDKKECILNIIGIANEKKINVIVKSEFVNILEPFGLMSSNIKVLKELETCFTDNYCYDIKTPIVCIGGMGLEEEQFCLELQFQNSLLEKGVNFFQIGSNKFSDFYKMNSIPSFIDGENIRVSEKICLFNHFIKKIEMDYSPDIIVIGIPSNLITINEKIESDYGSIGYLMVSSLNVDYCIINIPDRFMDVNKLPELSQLLDYRYGLYGDYYVISKKMIDIEESRNLGKLQFLDLSKEDFICDYEDDSIASYIDNNIGDILVEKMMEKLSYYGGVKFV